MLGAELFDLKSLGLDLGSTAFDEDELSQLLSPKGAVEEEDEVPPTPTVPVTKAGDLWLMGNHRLLCGDSTSGAQIATLMDGQLADAYLTDPPTTWQ